MYCSKCGKEGTGKFCEDCGGPLIEKPQNTEEKKFYIPQPRTPLETDEMEYLNNARVNMTEVMEYYAENQEHGIEVLAYISGLSLKDAENYIWNRLHKDSKPQGNFLGKFKGMFGEKKKRRLLKEGVVTNDTSKTTFQKQTVKTDFLEIDDNNIVTFRSIDMMFTGSLVAKANNDKYVMATGTYGSNVTIDCYVFFNKERALYKAFTDELEKEAFVTNNGCFSLLTMGGKFYLYDLGQKETIIVAWEDQEEIQIMTSYFCERFTILLYKKENKYYLSIYNTQKGSFIYKKYFDIDFEQISKCRIQVTDVTIELLFPCGLMLQYDFAGNATNLQEEKNTLNRLYYPIAYVNNAMDKIELLRQEKTEARMREIRALFDLAIEKVGDMYWCYDNYACFEAEFGDISLAKKYLIKAENSQNARNAALYKKCAAFAIKRDAKEEALSFLEKAIQFQVETETIATYKALKQELEEKKETETKKNKKFSSLFKKKEKPQKPVQEEKPKQEEKKEAKSLLESFLPEDVLEQENTTPAPTEEEAIIPEEEIKSSIADTSQENIATEKANLEGKELSDFEKRKKAREEMRARHRNMRKTGHKTEE